VPNRIEQYRFLPSVAACRLSCTRVPGTRTFDIRAKTARACTIDIHDPLSIHSLESGESKNGNDYSYEYEQAGPGGWVSAFLDTSYCQ
jgi:hypothetical protein